MPFFRSAFVAFGLVGWGSFCFGASSPSPSPKPVPLVMYDFLGNLLRLQPYMVSDSKFKDPANQKEVGDRLKDFVELSKRLSHSQRLDSETFQVSSKLLQGHFVEMRDAFVAGRKDYARRMLNATIDGCGSCHTQVVQDPALRFEFKSNEIKGDDFDRGEFLFAVRHYDEALKAYDSWIREFNRGKRKDLIKLETALKRKLFIFVRVKRLPTDAMDSFKKDLQNKKWPKSVRTEVEGWIDAFRRTPQTKPQSGMTAESLEAMASKNLPPLLSSQERFKPGATVQFLYVSGLMYDFINTHPAKDVTPGLIYWLAICDGHLNLGYFFSFSDLYLKACIEKFPKSPEASKCYRELESTTIDAYTGSSGINLPDDVKVELDRLKNIVSGKSSKE